MGTSVFLGGAVDTQIELSEEAGREIARWARSCLPEEACGLLLGREDDPSHVVTVATAAQNLAPSGRNERYTLDPKAWLEAEDLAQEQDLRIVGVWHSHPGGPATLSALDASLAYPGLHYLVVGIDPTTGVLT